MKIAVVVHGRFHAFDLARALLARGHDVTLFTNYPKWAVERFGVTRARVRSYWVHGVTSRLAGRLCQRVGLPYPEARLHQSFGRWAAVELVKERWDAVHCFSGASEEILQALQGNSLTLLMRGSAHIRTQARILEEEENRTGRRLDRPSSWMIAREERECALADRIVVLSTFCWDSFLAEGVDRGKLCLLPLGAQVEAFRPTAEALLARRQRLLTGEPLRTLHVGTFSMRKGAWDMATIVRELGGTRFHFRFVGAVASEALPLAARLRLSAKFVAKQPQFSLPDSYAWGDVLIAPTLEDGFQTVLGQAAAASLPILTTPNGAGRDLIRDGETGWILPIRNPAAFIDRLRWCDAHRQELATMAEHLYYEYRPRDWADVAADFEKLCALRSG